MMIMRHDHIHHHEYYHHHNFYHIQLTCTNIYYTLIDDTDDDATVVYITTLPESSSRMSITDTNSLPV